MADATEEGPTLYDTLGFQRRLLMEAGAPSSNIAQASPCATPAAWCRAAS